MFSRTNESPLDLVGDPGITLYSQETPSLAFKRPLAMTHLLVVVDRGSSNWREANPLCMQGK